MFVVGTAGHVDHGKTALINAITGMDPDRLQFSAVRFVARKLTDYIQFISPRLLRSLVIFHNIGKRAYEIYMREFHGAMQPKPALALGGRAVLAINDEEKCESTSRGNAAGDGGGARNWAKENAASRGISNDFFQGPQLNKCIYMTQLHK